MYRYIPVIITSNIQSHAIVILVSIARQLAGCKIMVAPI